MSAPRPAPRAAPRRWRGWWLKQLHAWHWISAAVSLTATLLFAATGITLNHAATIPAEPKVEERAGAVPPPLLRLLAGNHAADAPLPPAVADAVERAVDLDPGGRAAEWSDAEAYVALPRPGGDAWISVDRGSGAIKAEVTSRGWISWLNDLHKGRNTGDAWFWFIDAFAAACILFTLTGLLLLQFHARRRPATWPLVALGVAAPVLIAAFLIH